jgi:apolipoprotein N-acyltransferase
MGINQVILFFVSLAIVAFGQPVWSGWIALLAAFCGYALFWRVLLDIPSAKHRFILSLAWFGSVQLVQYSWVLSHPYFYIYFLLIFTAALFGTQFALISVWIKPSTFNRLSSLFALAGGWVLLEWSRHFIFSGLPFNPSGLALSGAIIPLQTAALGGVYALSFLVILTNLLFLRAWISPSASWRWALPLAVMLFPYFFGSLHLYYHEQQQASQRESHLNVLLVQSALPIEENVHFQSAEMAREYVLGEWKQVLSTLKSQQGKSVDLIALPEYLVPFGTFYAVFPLKQVQELFLSLFGEESFAHLPEQSPFADDIKELDQRQGRGDKRVSNAYIVQALATLFQADVVIGLEDSVYVDRQSKKVENYSAAFHFSPDGRLPTRYEKRILLPLGEYIPFEWCRDLAAAYGVGGSFTPGEEAKVFQGAVPMGISICYEEIFGDLMRENRVKGAEVLINLTNDGWYPKSRLPWQHFDHARLRTVENGIPLVRACNTGITGAVDSLGRVVAILGEGTFQEQETPGSLYVQVPCYHYQTLYSLVGDRLILAIAVFGMLCPLLSHIFKEK